jgi:hypothetical protein
MHLASRRVLMLDYKCSDSVCAALLNGYLCAVLLSTRPVQAFTSRRHWFTEKTPLA